MALAKVKINSLSHSSIINNNSSSGSYFRPRLLRQFIKPKRRRKSPIKRFSTLSAMDATEAASTKELPLGWDPTMEDEYVSLSRLLLEFTNISSIDKAWVFRSGSNANAMFSFSQPNLLANKKRKLITYAHISKEGNHPSTFHWSPFPIEMSGVSMVVPSPSGSKILFVRNPENDSPTKFEICSPLGVEKEFLVPQSAHGSVYADGWFEGVSWNFDETLVAYVAEEPSPSKPMFNRFGYKSGGSTDKDSNNWKGQGDWEEGWGESYVNKRRPTLFVIDVKSGDVRAVKAIGRSLSVGQVVWAPTSKVSEQHLVFVGWPSETRKLGMKYCFNRTCALYAVRSPFDQCDAPEESNMVLLTQGISSAFCPRFSPDGKYLIFLSARSSVNSGAHCSTNSLHRVDWPMDGKPKPSPNIIDVVPVVMCPGDSSFPGLYCSSLLVNPWLSDGHTIILSSIWGSSEVILSVDVLSGGVLRITPHSSNSSWRIMALDEDNIVAVYSSPIEVPEIKYGCHAKDSSASASWNWQDITSPLCSCSNEVKSLLSSLQFNIMKIPVRSISDNSPEGAKKPFEAIFVSKSEKNESHNPLIVILHGGPHSVSTTNFSKSLAFLSSIGYNLLIVNYRGSLGFGEEALQSLPGKVGFQDVNDVLTALDHVINMGLADPSKIAVLGGSHGGFLTTHLIGQAPEKFAVATARNPVCNLALMVGTSDIPDWCFVETYGSEWKVQYTEGASKDHLNALYNKSPIAHLQKVKTPTLFLLGGQDLRVPVSNGLQYARALKERGVEFKLIVFPDDTHAIDRPQSDYESFLNIGVWFKKYCK